MIETEMAHESTLAVDGCEAKVDLVELSGLFYNQLSEKVLCLVSFRRNSFTVVFCYLVEACRLNPRV